MRKKNLNLAWEMEKAMAKFRRASSRDGKNSFFDFSKGNFYYIRFIRGDVMSLKKRNIAILLTVVAFSFTACSDESSTDGSIASAEQKETSAKLNSSCNNLSCATWYVTGDSFSHGDWTDVDPAPRIPEGKYAGELPVYSYLIGNRTGCNVKNISANGSTISYVAGSGFTKPSTGLLYTNDFSDANIITIYYGINDSHAKVPIGSIDDTDPTTFYGAFNTTIEYITKHYPKARIGIIVSNGCETEDYPNATVEVAKKWGIPYLDLDAGVNGVTMLSSSPRNPATPEEKQAIFEQQRVCTTNGHPNEYAHALESELIEDWLQTLF